VVSINNNVKVYEKALSLCEEFTDCILYDSERRSIVINIEASHLDIVEEELSKLDYKLIFTSNTSDSVTCTFSYDHTTSEC
jgi:hypothetical protein